jgi:large subunit ribosomal protein L17
MRHRKKGKKIGRTSAHRKRTLQALSSALIENKRITTTVAKAKALRPFVEPLITRAKEDTEHNRRQVFRHLQNKAAIRELFDEVGDRVGGRPGGYTRIIRLGRRSGDGAEMAMVELVDYNDVKPAGSSSSKSKTRRGSGKGRRSPEASSQEDAEPEASASPQPAEDTGAADAEPSEVASSDADQAGEGTDPSSKENEN